MTPPDATAELIARIRAARLYWLPLDDAATRQVQWRLPTWEEQIRLMRGGVEQYRAATGLVVDWQGITEADLEPGGDAAHPVAFSDDAWRLALDQHVEWVPVLLAAVIAKLDERRAAQEAARGN
jgi:hypothetical protein